MAPAPRSGTDATDSLGYSLFDTALGTCAIAWSASGIRALRLPTASLDEHVSRMEADLHAVLDLVPPDEVSEIVANVVGLLAGRGGAFDAVPLDLRGVSRFYQEVYEVTRGVPAGRTTTYGEIARILGVPGAARAVGQALGRNPVPLIVPCHRVLAAGGKTGGFSAPGGVSTKLRILAIEASQQSLFGLSRA